MSVIVTISREFGSGGREIGLLLAKKMKIPFYDRELITSAAEKGGLSPTVLSEYEEKVFSDFYRFSAEASIFSNYYYQPITDKIYFAQRKTILELAAMGPCVIVGRCSDYVLKDFPNLVNFYLYSDLDSRVKRVQKYYNNDSKNLQEDIERRDKKRATYYNYYTTQRWGAVENYHLSVHTDSVGIDGCVDILEAFIKAHEREAL